MKPGKNRENSLMTWVNIWTAVSNTISYWNIWPPTRGHRSSSFEDFVSDWVRLRLKYGGEHLDRVAVPCHQFHATFIKPHKISMSSSCILNLIGVQKTERGTVKWNAQLADNRRRVRMMPFIYPITFLKARCWLTQSGLIRMVQESSTWSECCTFQSRDFW